MIAARCLGGAERCLEDAFAYATEREQFGERIIEFQGVSFPLAEAVADIAAARAVTYQVAWEVTQGTIDPKTLHAKAASIKLFASEMANRVVDSCVQVLGGRGYMRENAVERFYRDLRVDRIWEGTSEIQKVVLVNEMRKRGTHAVAAWPKQG
jgi:alkylation response protein AidB-like acyl-CoA dehydrogenase